MTKKERRKKRRMVKKWEETKISNHNSFISSKTTYN